MKNLPPLTKVMDKGPESGHEFERLMKKLLIHDGSLKGYIFEPGAVIKDLGIDGLVKENYPGMTGPVIFQFKWLTGPINKGSDAQQIKSSFANLLTTKINFKSYVLVTPHDLTRAEKEWLERLPKGNKTNAGIYHYGHTHIQVLLDAHPALKKYYYGEQVAGVSQNFNVIKEKYKKSIIEEVKHLQFIGLPTGSYVKQQLIAKPELIKIYIPRDFAKYKESPETITLNNIMETSNRVVILGDPGTGKSTLAKYLALIHGQGPDDVDKSKIKWRIPFIIPIREFVRMQQEKKSQAFNFIDYLKHISEVNYSFNNMDKDFFIAMLEMEKAIVLFDGLDEVASESGRIRMSKNIRQFALNYPDSSIWVTSRIVGYTVDVKLDEKVFDRYYLAPVSPAQTRQFIEKWYEIQVPKNETLRKDRVHSLQTAIEENAGVQRLKTNPLLLTMMTLVHQFEGTLPDHRAKLYEKCIELLLKTWQEQKYSELGIKNPLEERGLNYNDQLKLLAATAFYIQKKQDMGEGTSGLIEEKELVQILFKARFNKKRMSEESAKQDVKIFLDYINDRAGLLVEKGRNENGENVFAFVHLSLLEYLCAYHLVVDKSKSQKLHVDELLYYMRKPAWEETILLSLYIFEKSLGPSFIDAFSEAVFKKLTASPDNNGWLLLGRAVRDNIGFSRGVIKKILNVIIQLYIEGSMDTIASIILKEISVFSLQGKKLLEKMIQDLYSKSLDNQKVKLLYLQDELFGISDTLELKMRDSIKSGSYREARKLLMEMIQKKSFIKDVLMMELGFLFNMNKTEEEDLKEIEKNLDKIQWFQKIWSFLSKDNSFDLKSQNRVKSEEQDEPDTHTENEVPEYSGTSTEILNPYEKGKKLEVATVELLRSFFTINEDSEAVINALSRENAGNQYGHDIRFEFKIKDTVRDNQNIKCHIECKNYKQKISLGEVAEKVAKEEMTYTGIHYWILISPYREPTTDLKKQVAFWNNKSSYPFDIQIWSPETGDNGVEELFALNPNVHDRLYPPGIRKLEPTQWTTERRQYVYETWKDRIINLPLRLPDGWEEYLRNYQFLLFKHERKMEYDSLYKSYVPLKCEDINGNTLGSNVFQYTSDWLKRENAPVMFLLGEFGSGKTAFTYYLSRKLIEVFKKNIKDGWIPVRFSLREFCNARNSQDFIEMRLKLFNATLGGWTEIKNDYNIVVMLDGFDEMSVMLDSESIKQNIYNLESCYREFTGGKSIKILITSRMQFLKGQRTIEDLSERFQNPEYIFLEPFTREIVKKKLEEHAKTQEEKSIFKQLLKWHDPIGLGTKPLFFQMLKDFINNPQSLKFLESGFNELKLYESYAEGALKIKPESIDLKHSPLLIKDIRENMKKILEEIALEIHIQGDTTKPVFLSQFHGEKREFAKRLWEISSSEEDAQKRVKSRSLLSVVKTANYEEEWPVVFCHRSMGEYFAAKRIYTLLKEAPDDATRICIRIKLNFEIVDFLSAMMREDGKTTWKDTLVGFIESTRNSSQKTFLGSNAVTILYRLYGELPDIDWTNLNLDESILNGANLSKKAFTGTSFKYSKMDNVNFEDGDFRKCKFQGVRIEETGRVQKIAAVPGSDKIIAAYDDGRIIEWDITHPRKNKDHFLISEKSTGNFEWLGLSPFKEIIAVVNNEMILYSRSKGGDIIHKAKFLVKPEYRVVTIKQDTLLVSSVRENEKRQFSLFNLSHDSLINETLSSFSFFENFGNDFFVYTTEKGKLIVEMVDKEKNRKQLTIESKGISTLGIFEIKKQECYSLAAGHQDGEIVVWELKLKGSKFQYKKIFYYLYANKSWVNAIAFLEKNQIACGIDQRVIILNIDNYPDKPDKIPDRLPLQLTVKCKGMKIDHIEGPREKEKFKELIAKAQDS